MSTTGVLIDVAREMRGICGEEHVAERVSSGFDVSPQSADETAGVLRVANEHGLRVVPTGGCTELNLLGADVVLHANRLTQIEHYDHADLTVGIGAGMTVAQLNTMVGADNLMFAADPSLPERCTVGGILATAGHGPLRHGYGGVRDFCIGVRFVTGDGRKAKGGGRVVKNVAGYDLMKLLIGSYGTLGVITSASFKLFPAPRQTRTFLAEFASAAEALQFRDQVMRSPLSPMCLELVSPGARKLMRAEMTSDAWVMCVRASGSDAVLARYRKELGSAITRELDGEDERAMWRAISDFPVTERMKQQPSWPNSLPHLSRLSIFAPSAEVASVIGLLNEMSPETATVAFVGRVGIGHLLVSFEIINLELTERVLLQGFTERLPRGTQIRWSGLEGYDRWPAEDVASMRAVKQALDPKNILRGRGIF